MFFRLQDDVNDVILHLSHATRTDERLEKLLEIVAIVQTRNETFKILIADARENVDLTINRVKAFEKILSEIVDPVHDAGGSDDDGVAEISISVTMLFTLLIANQ